MEAVKKYRADDGTEFDSADECRTHERRSAAEAMIRGAYDKAARAGRIDLLIRAILENPEPTLEAIKTFKRAMPRASGAAMRKRQTDRGLFEGIVAQVAANPKVSAGTIQDAVGGAKARVKEMLNAHFEWSAADGEWRARREPEALAVAA
jgi:hypothetical protein